MIGLVTPWFGPDLKGGAEQLARQMALRLTERGHDLEVLTTRSRSFLSDWERNELREGLHPEHGIRVRRFSVNRRDADEFDRLNRRLVGMTGASLVPGIPPLRDDEEETFWSNHLGSDALLAHLKSQGDRYRAILFLPFLYAPIVRGLPLVASRAILHPCLHDEGYAYLREVGRSFALARRIVLNSEGELNTLRTVFSPVIASKAVVVGTGIEVDGELGRNVTKVGSYKLQRRFALCLGRRDEGKGTGFLVRCFREFREKNPKSRLELVVAGPGTTSWADERDGIVDLGFVTDEERIALLNRCVVLAQPSMNESYSRVIMEAWRFRKPVLVQRQCAATALAVKAGGGGWVAQGESEWIAALEHLDAGDPGELDALGAKGSEYARSFGNWEEVLPRYERLIDECAAEAEPRRKLKPRKERIDQVLPNLAEGDAISNYARFLRDRIRDFGFASEIHARYFDSSLASEVVSFERSKPPSHSHVLYHHSIGSEVTDWVKTHPGRKALIYHNITPGNFVRPFNAELADLLDRGLRDLPHLACGFPVSAGDSSYNAGLLKEAGFPEPFHLPIPVPVERLAALPDAAAVKRCRGSGPNILFVGRVAPHKRIEDLVFVFAELARTNSAARLHIVGSYGPTDRYARYLKSLIGRLGLSGRVDLVGAVSEAALIAYYRCADVFLCLSEHEGMCIPLVEAMWFEIPIVAFKCTAVPETLGDGGLLLTSKDDRVRVAALLSVLAENQDLRQQIIEGQRERREEFLSDRVERRLREFLERFTGVTLDNV